MKTFPLQVFIKLTRRYKYLEKMFEEEMKKVLVFIKGFKPIDRIKLARMTALWIGKDFSYFYIIWVSCVTVTKVSLQRAPSNYSIGDAREPW